MFSYQLNESALQGYTQVGNSPLPANVRLGWNCLSVINTTVMYPTRLLTTSNQQCKLQKKVLQDGLHFCNLVELFLMKFNIKFLCSFVQNIAKLQAKNLKQRLRNSSLVFKLQMWACVYTVQCMCNIKTAYLKVEYLDQTTFRLTPVSFRVPLKLSISFCQIF